MTLPQQYRFQNSKQISFVLKKGKKKNTPFFRVFSLSSRSDSLQIAVIVSRKIAAKAVERNVVRRRLQEAIRITVTSFPEKLPTMLLVFFASVKVRTADFKELKDFVQHFFLAIKGHSRKNI